MIRTIATPYWRLVAITIIVSLSLVRLAGVIPAHAQALPAFPLMYYGTATIQGAPVKDGALITARVGGAVFGPAVGIAGSV